MQTLGCPIMFWRTAKRRFYPALPPCKTAKQDPRAAENRGHCQKAGLRQGQRKRRAEVRARKKVETEIEELGAHIVELENEINDPEVLRDHLLLRDKCDELDDTRFHQQELYDEWGKAGRRTGILRKRGRMTFLPFCNLYSCPKNAIL